MPIVSAACRTRRRAIPKQSAPKPLPLERPIDREAPEHGDRNGIGHVAPEARLGRRRGDRARCERVIGNHPSGFDHDETARCAAGLIRQRPSLKPKIERRVSRDEIVERMTVVVGSGARSWSVPGRAGPHRAPQTRIGPCRRVETLHKSRVGFGSHKRRLLSTSASSAARRAASRTKSVRVFP